MKRDRIPIKKTYIADYRDHDGTRIRIWVGSQRRLGKHEVDAKRSKSYREHVTVIYAGRREVAKLDNIPHRLENIWELLVEEAAKRLTYERADPDDAESELRVLREQLVERVLKDEDEE